MTHPLERITIASPCQADWNEMQGSEQVRFCQQCQLNVYNLSGMSRTEAENLVASQEGRLCVRFFQRNDGTVITQDCPVGLKALHRRKVTRWGATAAALTLITVAGAFIVSAEAKLPKALQGEPSSVKVINQTDASANTRAQMGDVAVPMMGAPAVTPQPHPTQGLMATPAKKLDPIQGNIVKIKPEKHPAKHPVKPCKLPKLPKRPAQVEQFPPAVNPLQTPAIMGKIAAPRDLNAAPTRPIDDQASPQKPGK